MKTHGLALRLLLFLLFLALFSQVSTAQGFSRFKVLPSVRKDYVRQTRKAIRRINPDTVSTVLTLDAQVKDSLIYQFTEVLGPSLIQFETGDWIYVISHSRHKDHRIGDVTIARDQDGRFYYHCGHVCGGEVRFEATSEELCITSEVFFRNFKDEADELSWQPLKGNLVPD